MAANAAGDDALSPRGMRPRQPQRGVGAAFVHWHAPLRHLKTLTLVEEAVPAFEEDEEESESSSSVK